MKYVYGIRKSIGFAGALACLLLLASCRETPDEKFARFMKSGDAQMAKKDPGRAALSYRNAAQLKPNDPKALLQLGKALLAMGDYRQGVRVLRLVLDLEPKNTEAIIAFSKLKIESNDRELLSQAQTDLSGILAENGNNAEALHLIALSELRLGDAADATKHLEQALANAPQNLVVAATLTQSKLFQNDRAGAEEVLKKAVAGMPTSSDAATLLARFYVSIKRYPEALAEYQRAISLDSKNTSALLGFSVMQNGLGKKSEAEHTLHQLAAIGGPENRSFLPLFLFENGRIPEAIKEFESLHKDYPDNRQVRTMLVVAYKNANRKGEAEKLLNDVLVKNPKDADALVQQAEFLIDAGKFDQAETDLNAVLRLNPDAPELHFAVAQLYRRQGSHERSRQELSKVLEINKFFQPARIQLARELISIGQGKAALTLLDEAPQSQRDTLVAQVQRNWAYWSINDMAAMRKGIDLGLGAQRTPDLLVQDGMWKLQAGNAAAARASLEEALRTNPNDVQALTSLRDSYLSQKQLPEVIAKMKELAAAQPKSAAVQEFLGTLLMASGSQEEARKALEAAKGINQRDVKAELHLAQLDISQRRWEDAKKRLEGIVAQREDSTARLWLGNIAEATGNQAVALDQYRKAVADDPSDTSALNNLAYLLLTQGKDADQALKYAQQAVERNPDDLNSKDTLGWVLYSKGSYAMAVKHLEVAAKGKSVVPKYHLAMAYAKAGSMPLARTTLAAALKQNSTVPEARLAQDLVK